MTVAELKEILTEFPEEAEVLDVGEVSINRDYQVSIGPTGFPTPVNPKVIAICDEFGMKRNGQRMACQRCGDDKDLHHYTPVGDTVDGLPPGGPGPLCQDCWSLLSPSERLPFYRRLHDYNAALGERIYGDVGDRTKREWGPIEKAVLSGL